MVQVKFYRQCEESWRSFTHLHKIISGKKLTTTYPYVNLAPNFQGEQALTEPAPDRNGSLEIRK